MNLILLSQADYIADQQVRLEGRRAAHILTTLAAQPGDTLKAGLINGPRGQATVLSSQGSSVLLQTHLTEAPPAPLPVTLLLGLPRPKMLRRILLDISMLGVKQLYLINSYRVDKSYWSTPLLQPDAIHQQLLLGLEQSGDTQLPEVHLRKRFKAFVEDELPQLARQHQRSLVAHPYTAQPCPAATQANTLLAIGPEGGFIPYEVDKLQAAGLDTCHIGERILRVETAIACLLARLFTPI